MHPFTAIDSDDDKDTVTGTCSTDHGNMALVSAEWRGARMPIMR